MSDDAPTVADAIAALTDPALRGMGPAQGKLVPVRGFEVLGRLQQRGLSQEDAHALVRTALHEIGGEDRSGWLERRGLRAGGLMPRAQWNADYWVPAAAVRDSQAT